MNLYELCYLLIKENKENLAEEFLKRLANNCVNINTEDIKEAARFRFKEIKRKLSYLDCLGYVLAKKHNVKFLTGDIAFKEIPNVKYVH
ncbi:PIN domain-containing protein [Candidatus Pacearchaeota archaeon]|nr:PIN domain-containing protein [Candidatus Pacearchaeota archaeon]